MKISKQILIDKIHGCWIGKNIGGTFGGPYESRQELLDIKDFVTKPGEVLANDDLDLQLVWLRALEDRGVRGINEQVLGEYWLSYIVAHWAEYGTGKFNMKMGLVPPLSGEYENVWKDSNGAWIRSEIWACICAADPDNATRFGFYDACVDHGMAEGTYAAIFTTAIESAAFVESDVNKLIDIGLSRIPEDCKLAKCINIVRETYAEYEAGNKDADYVEARRRVLDHTLPDLGWFQAPGNVAFVVIGMLYGEGDFKKSMIIATNCGDDTDCTAATIGSLFGIIMGASGLPADWKERIGDSIVSVALDLTSDGNFPWLCTNLRDRTYKLLEQSIRAFNRNIPMEIVDDESMDAAEITEDEKKKLYGGEEAKDLRERSGYETRYDFIHMKVEMDMQKDPVIQPGEEFTIKFKVHNMVPEPRYVTLNWVLPDGWDIRNTPQRIYLRQPSTRTSTSTEFEATVVAGDEKDVQNRIILEMVPSGRPTVGLIPIMFL